MTESRRWLPKASSGAGDRLQKNPKETFRGDGSVQNRDSGVVASHMPLPIYNHTFRTGALDCR